jgi:hypothetical protein
MSLVSFVDGLGYEEERQYLLVSLSCVLWTLPEERPSGTTSFLKCCAYQDDVSGLTEAARCSCVGAFCACLLC